MSNQSRDEPSTAPKTDQWYDLVLGPSAKDDSSHKFCTLRYEFKPASIDRNRPATLHKKKDNRVSLEFQNNQPGKAKVTFEGSSEDYKENDAVLFFDGEKFRLERLHRAVKQLRHVRTPGESAAASQATVPVDHRLSPVGRAAKSPQVNRSLLPEVPVEVERIEIGKPENSAEPAIPGNNTSAASPVDVKADDGEEHHEIDLVEIFGSFTPENENVDKDNAHDDGEYADNLTKQLSITEEEIADVDEDSGGEGEKGLNAAEALRAQVNAEVQKDESSSSSSSSGSSSGSDSDGRSKSASSGSGSGGQSSSGSSSRSRGSGGSDDEDEVNSV